MAAIHNAHLVVLEAVPWDNCAKATAALKNTEQSALRYKDDMTALSHEIKSADDARRAEFRRRSSADPQLTSVMQRLKTLLDTSMAAADRCPDTLGWGHAMDSVGVFGQI